MKEKVFILYIGMILLVGGCYDDKGNYDYTDIGDITITGIENSYTAIALAKKLEIKPTVTSKNPEDTFEYLWTVYNPNYYDSYLTEAIKGLAMTAGSKPILRAIIGREQPISLATVTATIRVRQTTQATGTPVRSNTSIFIKLAPASVTPQNTPTRISFHMTRRISPNSISSKDSPRMIVAEA